MRKYKRLAIRLYAQNHGVKHPSEFVQKMWERYQIKKYGTKQVAINRARGTHKKHLWKEHVAYALYGLKKGLVA